MKILMIVHGFPPECTAGTESYVLGLCRELKVLGHEVEVLCGSHESAGPDATEPTMVHGHYEGIAVHRLHRVGLFIDNWEKSFAPEVEPLVDFLLRDTAPDLVHVHHWIRLTRHLVELCHDRGIPTVCTLHDLSATCPIAFRVRQSAFCELEAGPTNCLGCAPAGPFMGDEEVRGELALYRDDFRNELELTRRLIVPSSAHRDVLLKHNPSLQGRFRVVPHGNMSPLRRQRPEPSLFPNGPLRIGHWGHLSFLKGLDILLEAVHESRHKDDIQLELFGEVVNKDERPRVDELAKGLRITWHGKYSPKDLAGVPMDLAVIPTRCSESWSFVLDEAFLLGLPAIVPDRGALKERIGFAGTTFLGDNARDLSRVLNEVFKNPAVLESWRARVPALPKFRDHCASIERIYREVSSLTSALSVTPRALRSRRLKIKSRQIELQKRRLESREHELGRLGTDLGGVRAELQRAQSTMDEMHHYHLEKDKEILRLNREVEALTENHHLERDHEILRLHGEIERSTQALNARVSAKEQSEQNLLALRAQVAGLEGRLTALLSEREQITSLRRDDHGRALSIAEALEIERSAVNSLRETLAIERRRARESEAQTNEESSRLRALGKRLASLAPPITDGDARPAITDEPIESATIAGEIERAESEARRLLEHANQREAWFASTLRERDAMLERLATTIDELLDAVQTEARRRRSDATGSPGPSRASKRRLKILMVLHQYLPRHVSGTEIYTRNLARELSKSHEVVILTAESDHARPRYERSIRTFDGIKVIQTIHNYVWNGFRDTYDSPESDAIFRAVLGEERPDIVHIQHLHHWSVNFVTIARTRGIPVVFTLHDYLLLCPRDGQLRRADGEICEQPVPTKCADCIAHHPLTDGPPPAIPRGILVGSETLVPDDVHEMVRRLRNKNGVISDSHQAAAAERLDYIVRAMRDVDLFIAPSDFLCRKFIESGMIPSDRIIVSDNGYDRSSFERFERIPAPGRCRIAYIGTIAEAKGVHVLIEAMNGIDDERVSCHVWGDLGAFHDYAERLRALNANPRVHLMGSFPPEQLTEILAKSDVLVVPSLWFENSPLTVHEAALAGIPVIASDRGGLAEYVKDGVTGLHFRLGDVADLRTKILQLLPDLSTLPRFNPKALHVKPIADDARDMEARYRRLLTRSGAQASAPDPR